MAKCVKKGNKFFRVTNEQAKEMVESKGYTYCSKEDWRRHDDGKEDKSEGNK
jgi:hypothetical protein